MRLLFLFCVAMLGNPWVFGADGPVIPKRFGKVIAVTGKATAMKPDGVKFELKAGDELPAGSTLTTEANGTVDLFFRRIGTIVQVQTNSTLALDKLEAFMKDGKLVKRTELTLSQGHVYACIRVLIPDSKFVVRTPQTTFHVPGTGLGRYELRADGSALVGKKSKLSLVADVKGEPVAVAPGEYFSGTTNVAKVDPARLEVFTQKMDALQNTAYKLTPPPQPEEVL